MPRMAARARAHPRSPSARRRRVASRAFACAALVVVGLSGSASADPQPGAMTRQEVVFLPAGEGRTVASGPAGWVAAPHVTAVGCGTVGCPRIAAKWTPSIGADGGADGALRAELSGLAGQAGTALVTWRSPVFLTPDRPASTSLTVLARRLASEAAGSVVSRVSVRVVPVAGGPTHTAVEGVEVSPSDALWTSGPVAAATVGALPPLALHRIEVELHFQFDSRATGDVTVDLDDVALAATVDDARLALAPPTAPDAAPSGPDGGPATSVVAPPTSDGAAGERPVTIGARLATCHDAEVVVLGASAVRHRVTVTGGSSRPPGTTVTLLGTDGWRLGAATVDHNGLFRLSTREPAAAGGSLRRVLARLTDGEASASAAVQRDHLLRSVQRSSVQRSGGRVAIEGTLAERAIARRTTVRLERIEDSGCRARRSIVASARTTVDQRTGRYRALVMPPRGMFAGANAGAPELFRAQVTSSGPGLPRRVTNSQTILVEGSDISVD